MNQEMLPRQYRVWWLIAGLVMILSITFFPYLFAGTTFLPVDLFDTMMAPWNAEYGPPQAQNHYIFDGLAQTYPYKVQTKEALEKGKLAYWNPHILGGYPQYAETLANNYDVFNILLLGMSPLDFIHWQTFLELLTAGIGMVLLLRFVGVSQLVNLLFSAAYMLNSMFIQTAMNRWIVSSFCWMPFVVLMILRYFQDNRKEDLLYASVFLALAFLGGNFQTSFFAVFICMIIILCYPSKNSPQKIISRTGILIAISAIAFAFSAIMWLPTLELFFQTLFRGGSLHDDITSGQSVGYRLISTVFLATFFLPEVLGNAQTYSLKKFAWADVMNYNGAIGFLPLLFAVWGCYIFWKNKQIRPFIIISFLGFLLPLATPLFSLLYHRFFIVSSFSFCIIGAVSFESFMQSSAIRVSFSKYFTWMKIIFSVVVASLVALWGYIALNYQTLLPKFTKYVSSKVAGSAFGTGNESWMYGRASKTLEYYSSFSFALWLPVLVGVIVIMTLRFYIKGKISERNVLFIVVLATTAQLVSSTQSWLPVLDTSKFPVYPKNPIMTYLQKDPAGNRFSTWRDVQDPYILPENAPNIYKTFDINGYETCTNRTFAVFYRHHILSDSLDLRLLGLANVKYIVTGKRAVNSANLRRVYSADSMNIYENILAKPRAYIAYKVKIAASDSSAALELLRPDFDGSEAVFTSDDAPHDRSIYSGGQNSIQFEKSDNEEVGITVHSDSKGIFVLTDTYYPGWICYVNGQEKPIYRVNNCMRAIEVGAGTSNIVFQFKPAIFTAGMSISAISILLGLAGLGFLKKKNKTDA